MRIGINVLFIAPGSMGGSETYIRNLIDGFQEIDSDNEYIIFTSQENDSTFIIPVKSNFHKVMLPCKSKGIKRVLLEQFLLPYLIRKHKLDVVFYPGGISCIFSRIPAVLTIHDLHHLHYPSSFSWGQRLYRSIFLPRSVQRVNKITTPSEFTATDVVKHLNVDMKKITVIYLSVKDKQFFETNNHQDKEIYKKYDLSQPYVLSVASTYPHKNLDGLLSACIILHRRGFKFNLVLVGTHMSFDSTLKKLIDSSFIKDHVKVLGYVPDADLPALYRGAIVYAFPSMFEGFGLPLLEAMMSGIPIVASNRGSLPEIGTDAAMFVEPDPKSISEGIESLLSNGALRTEMRGRGFNRAKQFSVKKQQSKLLH